MKLHESAKQVLLENSEEGATVITFTGLGTGRSAMAPSKGDERIEIVWNSKVKDLIKNLTDPYWGWKVTSQRSATKQEIEDKKKSDEKHGNYMYHATGPRKGSNYRGD